MGLSTQKKSHHKTKLQPTMIYHIAKYAMDLAFVEDKEIHMAIYVDDQIIVEELQKFLKKPVGDKVVFDEDEDKNGKDEEEVGGKSSAYKYLNIIKHFELIIGSLPHAPAASEDQSSTNNSVQNEGGSEEEVDEEAETESQASIELDLSEQVDKVLTVYYNLVKEYDVEVDQTDVDAVVDRQVNIESKAIR